MKKIYAKRVPIKIANKDIAMGLRLVARYTNKLLILKKGAEMVKNKDESYKYPKYVLVKKNETISKMSYEEIKVHNEDIIEDNIFHALKHGEYSENEINEYKSSAIKQLKELKKDIRENKNVVLVLDQRTQQYVIIK